MTRDIESGLLSGIEEVDRGTSNPRPLTDEEKSLAITQISHVLDWEGTGRNQRSRTPPGSGPPSLAGSLVSNRTPRHSDELQRHETLQHFDERNKVDKKDFVRTPRQSGELQRHDTLQHFEGREKVSERDSVRNRTPRPSGELQRQDTLRNLRAAEATEDEVIQGFLTSAKLEETPLGKLSPSQWLLKHYRTDRFSTTGVPKGADPEKPTKIHLTLSFAALNRMRMRKLQVMLMNRMLKMHYGEEEPDDWEELLEKYVKGTRDNEFIHSCVERGLDDPFIVSTQKKVDALRLRDALEDIPATQRGISDEAKVQLLKAAGIPKHRQAALERLRQTLMGDLENCFADPVETSARAIGGTRRAKTEEEKARQFLDRLVISLVGGAFLVAPMWLMVLHNTTYTALVSVSVSVVLCGLVSAWRLDSPGTVLSTTAAYAAVLVVFVGTNTSGPS